MVSHQFFIVVGWRRNYCGAVLQKMENFRDHFVRERKKKKKPSGEKGPPFVSRWPYFEMLTFLDDTVRHRS